MFSLCVYTHACVCMSEYFFVLSLNYFWTWQFNSIRPERAGGLKETNSCRHHASVLIEEKANELSPCSLQKICTGKDILDLTPSVLALLKSLAYPSGFPTSKFEHPKLRLTRFNWTNVSEELGYPGFLYLLQSIHMLITSSGWNP